MSRRRPRVNASALTASIVLFTSSVIRSVAAQGVVTGIAERVTASNNCSKHYSAVHVSRWSSSGMCGQQCVEVWRARDNPDTKLIVKLVEPCQHCEPSDLELSSQLYDFLAGDKNISSLAIKWQTIACQNNTDTWDNNNTNSTTPSNIPSPRPQFNTHPSTTRPVQRHTSAPPGISPISPPSSSPTSNSSQPSTSPPSSAPISPPSSSPTNNSSSPSSSSPPSTSSPNSAPISPPSSSPTSNSSSPSSSSPPSTSPPSSAPISPPSSSPTSHSLSSSPPSLSPPSPSRNPTNSPSTLPGVSTPAPTVGNGKENNSSNPPQTLYPNTPSPLTNIPTPELPSTSTPFSHLPSPNHPHPIPSSPVPGHTRLHPTTSPREPTIVPSFSAPTPPSAIIHHGRLDGTSNNDEASESNVNKHKPIDILHPGTSSGGGSLNNDPLPENVSSGSGSNMTDSNVNDSASKAHTPQQADTSSNGSHGKGTVPKPRVGGDSSSGNGVNDKSKAFSGGFFTSPIVIGIFMGVIGFVGLVITYRAKKQRYSSTHIEVPISNRGGAGSTEELGVGTSRAMYTLTSPISLRNAVSTL